MGTILEGDCKLISRWCMPFSFGDVTPVPKERQVSWQNELKYTRSLIYQLLEIQLKK